MKKPYLYKIDKIDFDYVYLLTYKDLNDEDIKTIIENKFKDFSIAITFEKFVLVKPSFNIKDFENLRTLTDEIDDWPLINETQIPFKDLENFLFKKVQSYKTIQMGITKENKFEYFNNKFNELSNDLFCYNGRDYNINTEVFEDLKNLIKKIDEEISKK